jgi:hypothetical protein
MFLSMFWAPSLRDIDLPQGGATWVPVVVHLLRFGHSS